MICKTSSPDDLIRIAKCHIEAFPESLSSRLGIYFCTKMIAFYIEDDRGILFHLEEGEEVLGYCGSLMNKIPGQPGSASSMTQHTFKPLVLNLLIRPWLLFHHEIWNNLPLIRRNIYMRFFRNSGRKKASSGNRMNTFVPSMGLVVIGVSPKHQGKGYGSVLLKEFESRAVAEGFKRGHLSVKKNNYQAIAAYKKNGWKIDREGEQELIMFKNME